MTKERFTQTLSELYAELEELNLSIEKNTKFNQGFIYGLSLFDTLLELGSMETIRQNEDLNKLLNSSIFKFQKIVKKCAKVSQETSDETNRRKEIDPFFN